MTSHEVDGLNSGYARLLLDQYLENPDAVPEEWRRLFESGHSELVATHPGLARLLQQLHENGGSAPAETAVATRAPTGPRPGPGGPARSA